MSTINHGPLIIISLVQIGLALWLRRPRSPPPKSPKSPTPLTPQSPSHPPTPQKVFSRQNSLDLEKTCEAPLPTPLTATSTQPLSVLDPQMRTTLPVSCGLFSCCSGRNCGCDKTVKFINRISDKYIDIWIRPSNKFYLSGFGFKDLQGQIERTGPDEIIQNIRLPPGDTMEISVETFSYFISAAIDDQQLWFNRRFFTNKDIVFYERQLKRLKPMCKSFKELIE